ncbi:fused MFS/spermidine synthase [Zavarzinella formosa]|uniref:fused MFS/spermidine synthase n=1 Tax=Zavarzinella formosa TaxID=360055 RepID=UPI000318D3F7|nr:fused MFS/spermidine synthase [Zavarzinella formosa]
MPTRLSPALLTGLGAVVFLANAGLLVLQLLAGRYLAPFIGSSVETWTSVIGVFLTGIALGNHFGGTIADRSPNSRTLGILLLLGGISSLSMLAGSILCEKTGFDSSLSLTIRIPILAGIFCLPPAFIISLITPLTIKLMLSDVTKAGRVAGLVFALSTLGCLAGNYVTGFKLMAFYSLDTISYIVAIGMVVLSLPMFFTTFTAPASTVAAPSKILEDDPLGFKRDIRLAYAVVFVSSFCGMSLELTASRVLAPVLGVSLYSWTGIIGVMLAGTTCGNYLGGVLADRGHGNALKRFAVLMAVLIGFAATPAFLRSFSMDGYPLGEEEDGEVVMLIGYRLIGSGIAVGLVLIGNAISGLTIGKIINLFVLGAALGWTMAFPVARSLSGLADRLMKFNPDTFLFDPETGTSTEYFLNSLVIHSSMALLGGLISLGLLYENPQPNEKRPKTLNLTVCFFMAALFIGLIVIMNGMFQNQKLRLMHVLMGYDLIWNILTWTFLLFFLPMLFLGTISPQVIRLSIRDTARAGQTSGSIYAWSTAGAIVGTFTAGYFLLGQFGTARMLYGLAFVLMLLTFFIGQLWKSTSMLFVGSIILGGALTGLIATKFGGGNYTLETKYYAIKVNKQDEESGIMTMALDLLIHSYVKLDDPSWLGYKHEEIQGELVRYAHSKEKTNILIIGGGGYTFPRWVEHMMPDVGVDVVEIDPGVTEVAHRELGLSRNTKIKSFHMDGRQFMRETAEKGHYQLVIQDAVNDLSVPTHLMTKEYNDAVKATLTPDGAYLLTLIDSIKDGELWRAAVNTMRASFPHVVMLSPIGFKSVENRNVYVIYGSDKPLDLEGIQKVTREFNESLATKVDAVAALGTFLTPVMEGAASVIRERDYSKVFEEAKMDEYLAQRPKLILTDQYAPVDNLMGGVFLKRIKK